MRSAVRSAREKRSPFLIATRSAGKIRELRAMFETEGLAVTDLRELNVPESAVEDELETGTTYEYNALAKARHFHHITGLPTIADDSGIEVRALGNAPGVHSKRWTGIALAGHALDEANNALLLSRLAGVDDRLARYVCVAAYRDDEIEFTARGETEGRIVDVPRGNGGFGYDPYFESLELERTFAEVSMADKARVSHRARAIAKLLQRLMSER